MYRAERILVRGGFASPLAQLDDGTVVRLNDAARRYIDTAGAEIWFGRTWEDAENTGRRVTPKMEAGDLGLDAPRVVSRYTRAQEAS